MSTSHSPSAARMFNVVGEPLMNWRLEPALVKDRLRTSWFSSHGSSPFSSRNDLIGALSRLTSNSASTEQLSLPLRIPVRSARSPSTRFNAPMRMDLPAPVSPVMALKPGWSSSVRSATSARFLMRSVVSMSHFGNEFGLQSSVEQKENHKAQNKKTANEHQWTRMQEAGICLWLLRKPNSRYLLFKVSSSRANFMWPFLPLEFAIISEIRVCPFPFIRVHPCPSVVSLLGCGSAAPCPFDKRLSRVRE